MLSLLYTLLLALPPSVFAQAIPYVIPPSGVVPGGGMVLSGGMMVPNCNFVTGEFHYECVPLYLAYLIKIIFGMVGTVCLVVIIWAGFEWTFSGLKNDSQGPKTRLYNAVIGLILCTLCFLIVDTIVSALFT